MQKSKEGFKQLLEVISDEDFRPGDVVSTNWKAVDCELGGTALEDEEEWLDADGKDEDWHKASICMSVPFHSRCLDPGPKDYHTNFYHRAWSRSSERHFRIFLIIVCSITIRSSSDGDPLTKTKKFGSMANSFPPMPSSRPIKNCRLRHQSPTATCLESWLDSCSHPTRPSSPPSEVPSFGHYICFSATNPSTFEANLVTTCARILHTLSR